MSTLTANQQNVGDNRMAINPRNPQENQDRLVAGERNTQENRNEVVVHPRRLANVEFERIPEAFMPGFMTQDSDSSGEDENFDYVQQDQQPRIPRRQQDRQLAHEYSEYRMKVDL
ncbi:hypothetical protein OC713_02555, partial [Sweet potato little leaf phytoplasma]|uniref:hypothetical protein n=1 Tax=Candidatus Phytoplasma australasiaticum TaxID=2754999 RepID=UPI0027133F55